MVSTVGPLTTSWSGRPKMVSWWSGGGTRRDLAVPSSVPALVMENSRLERVSSKWVQSVLASMLSFILSSPLSGHRQQRWGVPLLPQGWQQEGPLHRPHQGLHGEELHPHCWVRRGGKPEDLLKFWNEEMLSWSISCPVFVCLKICLYSIQNPPTTSNWIFIFT